MLSLLTKKDNLLIYSLIEYSQHKKKQAIVKGTGSHKKRILLSISLEGIKISDEKSGEVLSTHAIPLISYISRDTSDNRAFGFVYGTPAEGHQFIGIKTEKAAIPVMQTIADLFTYVYEKRKREKQNKNSGTGSLLNSDNKIASSNGAGSDAVLEVLSFSSEKGFSEAKLNEIWNKTDPSAAPASGVSNDSNQNQQQQQPSTSSRTAYSGLSVMIPPALPAPPSGPSRSSDYGSRSSTLSSSQRSDTLAELRTMRHVINSANFAAAATNSSSQNNNQSSRYATWESFNESDVNQTISQVNNGSTTGLSSASVSNINTAAAASGSSPLYSSGAMSYGLHNQYQHQLSSTLNRPSSSQSASAASSGYDSMVDARTQITAIINKPFGAGITSSASGVLPSPPIPSSPRSLGGSFRVNRKITPPYISSSFTQPNQVNLPPPHAPILLKNLPSQDTKPSSSISSLIPLTSSSGSATVQSASSTSLYSSPAVMKRNLHQQSAPSASSSDIFGAPSFNVNFDAVFSTGAPPSLRPASVQRGAPPAPGYQPPVLQPLSSSTGVNPVMSSTGSISASSSSVSTSNADRYACLAEIQNLEFQSIFDLATATSSNSDSSGTFIGSPVMSPVRVQSSNSNHNNLQTSDENASSGFGLSWSTANQPPVMSSSVVPPVNKQQDQQQQQQQNQQSAPGHKNESTGGKSSNSFIVSFDDFNTKISGNSDETSYMSILNSSQSYSSNKDVNQMRLMTQDDKVKDAATSPGTPPGKQLPSTENNNNNNSSHNQSNSQQQKNHNDNNDLFSMSNLFKELDPISKDPINKSTNFHQVGIRTLLLKFSNHSSFYRRKRRH